MQQAKDTGDAVQQGALESLCRAMEVEAFAARRARERRVAGYVLQWGAGVGAGVAAAPLGPVAAYAVGAGAFAGLGIALDAEIHSDIQPGNWSGALHHTYLY